MDSEPVTAAPTISMVGSRRMQCKDIPDDAFLEAVRRAPGTTCSGWRMRWNVQAELEAILGPIPVNLFLAKARKLIAAKKMGGCGCGCRGDYELPDEAGITPTYDAPGSTIARLSGKLAGLAGLIPAATAWDKSYQASLDWQAREQHYLNQALAVGASEEAARDMLKAVLAEREKVQEMLAHGLGGADRIFDHDLSADVFALARGRLFSMPFPPKPQPAVERTLGTAYARWRARSG